MALFYSSQAALFVHFTHIATSIAKAFRKLTDRIEKEITSNIIEKMETTHNLPNVDFTHTTRTMVLTIKKLKNLMNTYWMLCDAVQQANDFYCYQLMAVTFNSFAQVTITCYAFFLHGRDGNMVAMLTEGAWILTHIYHVVVLVNSSTEVTNSAEETSQMICKLINNSNLDPVLRKELEGFLLQFPHHNARFSALGYFPIHNETLTAMAGAVTTYLVILIQFQAKPQST
ncbi:gustatory receptor [Homalodisca vitripennis]|nr:gustatory receptor [Homalodisca vitripennis]